MIKKVLLLGCWLAIVSLIVTFFIIVANEHIFAGKKFENMVNASVLIYDDYGHGSGVFIADNVILTAAHCLEDCEKVTIELSDGTVLESSDLYIDEEEDVGFIFVEADELHIAKVSEMSSGIGDTVYLVGAPYYKDFKFSLFRGIISHLDRDISEFSWKDLLQVDADSGSGNSGGPLYNSGGELIGMYVGQSYGGGLSISLCESIKDILEAYERYLKDR